MFKTGDKVVWIDKEAGFTSMTYGKSYKIIETNGENCVWVINNFGTKDVWHEFRFVLDVKYARKKKIKRCLR